MNSGHAEATRVLTSTVASLLPRGTRCGLAMYPDHWNTGDSAIWWGTRMLLDRLGVVVDYACDPWSYDPRRLRTALPEGPILLLGGGNFGDVYTREQGLRLRVLEDFRDRKIIQLPQSIWFRSQTALDEMSKLLARGRDFTLLVRDAASLTLAQEHFPSTAPCLCPDTALALELPDVDRTADVPVMALWRNDAESSDVLPPLPEGWISRDWTLRGGLLPADEALQLTTAARSFKEWVGNPPAFPEPCPLRRRLAWRHMPWLWDQLAEDRTLRGCRILARGRVVITNRLHAHLLCTMMGLPHVVCDTSNGKVFAYRDTWMREPDSHDTPSVRFANTPAAAVAKAAELLAGLPTQ
jgi:exopolysaccharide biosynthesis predicted pyruvyltransferase EpsI